MDVISDMLAWLRNGSLWRKVWVIILKSQFIEGILECLFEDGWIAGYEVYEKKIVVYLKYYNSRPVISLLERISKPSCRVYWKFKDIKKEINKGWTYMVSSSKGLYITTKVENLKFGFGGEILFWIG